MYLQLLLENARTRDIAESSILEVVKETAGLLQVEEETIAHLLYNILAISFPGDPLFERKTL